MVQALNERPARPGSRGLVRLRVYDPHLAFALRNSVSGLPAGERDRAWALVDVMDSIGAWTPEQYRSARVLLARGRGSARSRG